MMNQFQIIKWQTGHWLCCIDTSRYDTFTGFYRLIKKV